VFPLAPETCTFASRSVGLVAPAITVVCSIAEGFSAFCSRSDPGREKLRERSTLALEDLDPLSILVAFTLRWDLD
jgi:hypothetical protein